MKKPAFPSVRAGKYASLLVFAAAFALCACHDHDDSEDMEVELSHEDTEYALTVNTNVEANITFNGTTYSAVTTATFEGVTEAGTVTIDAVDDAYIDQTASIVLGANTSIALDVTLVKRSTETITLEETTTEESSISNDETNQEESGVEATVTVDAGTTITNAEDLEDTDLSTTVYVPAAAEADDNVEEGDTYQSDVLVVDCTPDGAEFDQPVTIQVTIADAEGTSVNCVSTEGDHADNVQVGTNTLTAEVSHFSAWTFVLNASVTAISTTTTTQSQTVSVNEGNNTLNYSKYTGFTPGADVQTDGLLYNFLKNQFGAPRQEAQGNFSIASSASGKVTYEVVQTIVTYTYVSGSRTFTANVYGAVQLNITDYTPGHSGGSGN